MKNRIAIYPGTFDPITLGHIDIIKRGCGIFDEVIVTIAENAKKVPMFTIDERVTMIEDAIKQWDNVRVAVFDGLLVDYTRDCGAVAIIRGLRAVSDFEFEFQMALMNRRLNHDVTTVFLMPNEKYTYLNSTIVREVASLGGDVSNFITPFVADRLQDKINSTRGKK